MVSPVTDTIYNSDQKEYIEAVNRGSFDLQWLKDERPTFGVHAKPKNERRGLTLQDINAAFAGEPEDAPTTRVMGHWPVGGDDGTIAMLEKMKTKVEEDESLSEAYGDMVSLENSVDDEINKALEAPSSTSSASIKLEELKAKMGL